MSVSAPDKNEVSPGGSSVPIDGIQTPEGFHREAVNGITGNLVDAGHSVDEEQVSAVAEAERILREAQASTPLGSSFVAEQSHDLGRAAARPFGGSEHGDLVRDDSDIHFEPIRRASKMANFWKKPISIINFLFKRNRPK